MRTALRLVIVLSAACALAVTVQDDVVSLAGVWRFELDPSGEGLEQRWWERSLPERVYLPGSLPAQGIGEEVTVQTKWVGGIVDRSWFTALRYEKYRRPASVKVPFWLQPDKYYSGAAWYQRDIEIPSSWRGKRVVLSLERPHWETRVWVDGHQIGTNDSLSTPHAYDLGALTAGVHRLTVRVCNGLVIDIGENSHGISDHTQGNWNGIAGRIEMRPRSLVWIEDVQVTPSITGKYAWVDVRIGNAGGRSGRGTVRIWKGTVRTSAQPDAASGVVWEATKDPSGTGNHSPMSLTSAAPASQPGRARLKVEFGTAARLWDEFDPDLQHLVVELEGDSADDTRQVTFGFREISTAGTQFTVNGRRTFLRGTLECAIFPRTGHPPTEVAEWKRIMGVAKAYGLNLLRFHSYCPPEAAFTAADELGLYLQVETCWPNQSTILGDGKPVDRWIFAETDRILKAYGNHPSFILMPSGNEPGGRSANDFLAQWVAHFRAIDPRRLFAAGSGWPQLPANQFHVLPKPRIQAWGEGLKSRINARPPETVTDYREFIGQHDVPVISHEIGQWCVYPNFDEISKYTGYLKPRNFEIFREMLADHHMADQARQFLLASGRLQTLCYKEDIESALRTPGMGGFELLDLHDFPGQGTALVGVLDPFWEEKGYVTAAEYKRFCNSTVPLARLSRRVFTAGELLEADIEVAHFGAHPLSNAAAEWKLADSGGRVVAEGRLPARDVAIGNGIPLGRISIPLRGIAAPQRCRLVVRLGEFENDWDLWIYPSQPDSAPPDALIVEELNAKARSELADGGKVLLVIPPKRVRNAEKDPVSLGFSSIFWNTAWTRRQPPTTLGILCDPKNPALAEFPTEFHSNWQWWYLVTRAAPMILDSLPAALRPTIQVIDDWFTARKLGLVFEARVGAGRILVCSIDLGDANPVARQLRLSLLRYMSSDRFQPALELDPAAIEGLYE